MCDPERESIDQAVEAILKYHTERFRKAQRVRVAHGVRCIGLELKFPVVDREGHAASPQMIDEFWDICQAAGYEALVDSHSGAVTGVHGGGATNPDYIRTTTGHCVLEFSVGHCIDLFALQARIKHLRQLAAELVARTGSRLLGLGIHPITPPGSDLLAKKSRHLFWDEVLPPCEDTPHGDTGSVELFTAIADSQVHVDIGLDEAALAVDLLNGLAGPQLALTANSGLWRGEPDPRHVAVRELFWDWWVSDHSRCGIPEAPFASLADYVEAVALLQPVLTRRDGRALSLCHYNTFADFYGTDQPFGISPEGESVPLTPGAADIDIHDRAFWWNARLSRFATIESRVSCQQPPGELLAPAALVLGLVEAADEAAKLLVGCKWSQLRELRVAAAHAGLDAVVDGASARELAGRMLGCAREGLESRGFGEEALLTPLGDRLDWQGEPARRVCRSFEEGGISRVIDQYAWV